MGEAEEAVADAEAAAAELADDLVAAEQAVSVASAQHRQCVTQSATVASQAGPLNTAALVGFRFKGNPYTGTRMSSCVCSSAIKSNGVG